MTDLIFTVDGNIYASKKLMKVPEFRELYNKHGKTVFGNFIIFLYYVYKTYSSQGNFDDITYMSELPLKERIDRVFENHIDRKYRELFIDEKEFIQATELYVKLQMPKLEQMYVNVKNDIDSYVENLSNVPFTKSVYITVETPKDLVLQGYPPSKRIKVEVENMDEKVKAIKMANELITYAKKMEEAVMGDRKKNFSTIGNKDIKIFENPDTLKELNFVLYEEEIFREPEN